MRYQPQKQYMDAAIEDVKTHTSLNEGGPFGACIVKDGEIISVAHNTVLRDHDPTKHAEINAIIKASQELKNHDLSGCVIYSTTEPCPMCFSAIHWANIDHIVYGTDISDVKKLGFNELDISNETMKDLGRSSLTISRDFEKEACQKLLNYWVSHSNKQLY